MRRWERWLPVIGLVLFVLVPACITAVRLYDLNRELREDPSPLDPALMELAREQTPAFLKPLLFFLTELLAPSGLLPLLVALLVGLVGWLIVRGHRGEAAGFALATLAPAWAVPAAKMFFGRPRPILDWALARETSYSFPSGHAAASVAIYGMLAFLVWRRTRRWRATLAAAAAAVVLAGGTGYSRVYLGVHYPSDVAAGFLVGAIWLASGILATEALDWAARGRVIPARLVRAWEAVRTLRKRKATRSSASR